MPRRETPEQQLPETEGRSLFGPLSRIPITTSDTGGQPTPAPAQGDGQTQSSGSGNGNEG